MPFFSRHPRLLPVLLIAVASPFPLYVWAALAFVI